MLDTLRSLPDRWPWLAAVIAVQRRFGEVHGGFLASAVTLAAFLSLFPLLLLVTAVVGFFAAGNADLAGRVTDQLGLRGDASAVVVDAIAAAETNRRAASVVGVVGLISSALGFVGALQLAYDTVWQVQGRGLKDKLFALGWLVGAGLLFVLSFVLTAAVDFVPGPAWPLTLGLGLAVGVGLFLWTSKVLANRDVPWRSLLPGAVLAAVGFEILKLVGGIYVPRAVASSSQLYGSIGVVFALIAWLFFFGRLLVYAAVVNVVRWEADHGTRTVEVAVPRLPGAAPTTASHSGAAQESATAPG